MGIGRALLTQRNCIQKSINLGDLFNRILHAKNWSWFFLLSLLRLLLLAVAATTITTMMMVLFPFRLYSYFHSLSIKNNMVITITECWIEILLKKVRVWVQFCKFKNNKHKQTNSINKNCDDGISTHFCRPIVQIRNFFGQ